MTGGLFYLCIALYGAIMGHLSRRILQLLPASAFPGGTRGVGVIAPAPRTAGSQQGNGVMNRIRAGFLLDYPCEISCALLFMAVLSTGGPAMDLPGGLVFSWFLLTLGWHDYFTLLLPDRLTGSLLICGLASRILTEDVEDAFYDGLLGAIWGGMMLWLVQSLFLRIRGYQGMGGGDIKLLAALGAWLGWQVLPGLCCGAALSGLALYAANGRTKEKMPFGPCLASAGWVIYISP